MSRPRILIACVGNIFFGDDAFGVEVARRLSDCVLPDGVRVIDFGIRGLDLTYALLDDHEAVILVDATPRGGAPGTLYLIEPDATEATDGGQIVETHGMDPVKVLRTVAAMGGNVNRLLLVGCEPSKPFEDDAMQDGLSVPVRAAVEEAVVVIQSLAARLLRGEYVAVCEKINTSGQEVGTWPD